MTDAGGVKVGVSAGGNGKTRVSVCAGTACVFAGSMKVRDAFEEEVAAAGLQDEVEVRIIGCHGLCSQGPLAVVSGADTYYPRLKVKDVKTVVEQHLAGGEVVEKLLYVDPAQRRAHRLCPRHPVLQGADAHRPARRGHHRPRADRRVPGAGRLRGRAQGAHHHAAGRDRRGGPRLRPARPRRRRLPDRPEVALRAQLAGRRQVRHLQRRRGRPRRVHGRLHHGRRPARRARGHAHRLVRHRRARGLHLRARRVPAGRQAPAAGHRRRRGARLPGRRHLRQRLGLPPQDQGGRRRLRVRRGDRAHRQHHGRARHAA